MSWKEKGSSINCGGGAVYGLGFMGALIFYLQHANGAAEIIVGVVKSILWPAFLTHRLFTYLGM